MKHILITLVAISFSFCAFAQDSYNLSDEVTFDPNFKIGKLDNGLTYYIRQNVKPEKRAEFFLVVNAGAILEEADQNGIAHFCEHMAFNGTKNFKKHDIINYLRSIGMKFGPEINAFTSHDVTNYMLQKVPVEVSQNIDTALLILHDWAAFVSLENEEIDNERGVIREEWRSGRDADTRMSKVYQKVLYKDSKYADHDVIGELKVINEAPYERFTSFYNDWYRPDLQAVIVIGDIDPVDIENRIKKIFADIPSSKKPKTRTISEVPDHSETLVSIVTDKEATNTDIQIIYKHKKEENRTKLSHFREDMLGSLYSQMINSRYQEHAQSENPSFAYARTRYGTLTRSKNAYSTYAASKNNEAMRCLTVLLTESKRVLEYGFTESEFERAKTSMLRSYERAYLEAKNKKSVNYTWECYRNFLEGTPLSSAEFDYNFAKYILPEIKLEEVNSLAEKWITDKNRVVIITAPEKDSMNVPSETDVLRVITEVNSSKVAEYIDKVSDVPFFSEIVQPGKIVGEKVNKNFDVNELTLSNGAKVYYKKTNFKEDEIRFYASSDGGWSLYGNEDDASAKYASSIVQSSGVGNYNKIELDKFLKGKVLSVSPSISYTKESLNGYSSPSDLEIFMQYLNLIFTSPRIEESSFKSYMEKQKTRYENKASDPASDFNDSIRCILSCYHERSKPVNLDYLNEINYDRLLPIFKERYSNPADFEFYFVGNIDESVFRPMVEKYIASIPSSDKMETWIDLKINNPKEKVEKKIVKEMQDSKATVDITYHGDFTRDIKDRVVFNAISEILKVRFTEVIREEQGGTYGVGVRGSISIDPVTKYNLRFHFDCDPEKADMLTGLIYKELEILKTEGPKQKDLDNFLENLHKERAEYLKENNFWISLINSYYEDGFDFISSEYENIVNGITAGDIKNMAKKLFNENRVELMLVPKK